MEQNENLTKTEAYLVAFAERLIRETELNKMDWKKYSMEYLELPVDEDGIPAHPLFTLGEWPENSGRPETVYDSLFLRGKKLAIAGDGYSASLDDENIVYLMKLRRAPEPDLLPMYMEYNIYELYLEPKRGEIAPLFYSGQTMNSPYAEVLQKLYQTIRGVEEDLHIREDVLAVIDGFMRNTTSTKDDFLEIPKELDDDPIAMLFSGSESEDSE